MYGKTGIGGGVVGAGGGGEAVVAPPVEVLLPLASVGLGTSGRVSVVIKSGPGRRGYNSAPIEYLALD